MNWQVVVTSAVVAAAVTGIINAVTQAMERRARRREILLAKAAELAVAQNQTITQMAAKSEEGATVRDVAVLTCAYYRELGKMLDSNKPVELEREERTRLGR